MKIETQNLFLCLTKFSFAHTKYFFKVKNKNLILAKLEQFKFKI
jgi:hypothetical protein